MLGLRVPTNIQQIWNTELDWTRCFHRMKTTRRKAVDFKISLIFFCYCFGLAISVSTHCYYARMFVLQLRLTKLQLRLTKYRITGHRSKTRTTKQKLTKTYKYMKWHNLFALMEVKSSASEGLSSPVPREESSRESHWIRTA